MNVNPDFIKIQDWLAEILLRRKIIEDASSGLVQVATDVPVNLSDV